LLIYFNAACGRIAQTYFLGLNQANAGRRNQAADDKIQG